MLSLIPRVIGISKKTTPLMRDMIALRLAPIDYALVCYSHDTETPPEEVLTIRDTTTNRNDCSKVMVLNPLSRRRVEKPIAEISSDHPNIPIETLARFFAFTCLGGTEEEFWQLVKYSDIIYCGDGAKYLPPGVQIVRRYFHGYDNTPKREGLKEIHLEGDNLPDVVPSHTRFHHLFHPPYTPNGKTLDVIAQGMFANIPPSIVEKSEAALSYHHSHA